MPFWSKIRLEEQLSAILENPSDKPIDCNSLVLRIGPEIYVTPHFGNRDPQTHTKVKLSEREGFTIPAGQFAFLLTEEFVSVPFNAMAFISVRTSVKWKGLVNISGFHVDPGYVGRLVFAVYNAGPAPIHLQRGDSTFLMWIADLDEYASPLGELDPIGRTTGTGLLVGSPAVPFS